MAISRKSLLALAMTLAAAGCAGGGGPTARINAQSTGSAYFNLSRPGLYERAGGLQLVGRVCRRGRVTLLSPPRVRLEHVSAGGDVVDTARAAVAPIYGRVDQPCSNYALRVAWRVADGDSIRACFDHGRACPADPASKALVTVPVSPVGPH